MGGGSLLTPLLVLVFGFNPTVAVGTDLLHGAIFKSVGAIRHRRIGNVQARLSGWMFLGSAPMSLIGVVIATWLRHRYSRAESVQATILGVALLLGAWRRSRRLRSGIESIQTRRSCSATGIVLPRSPSVSAEAS
jgi:uncharacterized membrane protein YfcA